MRTQHCLTSAYLVLALGFVCSPVLGQTPTAEGAAARITVRLPAEASLLFSDHATQQTGPLRSFISPPLTPGKTYVYKLKATWTENGQPASAEKEIEVQAGKEVVVDLNRASATPTVTASTSKAPKSREFNLTYSATITGLEPNQVARIWLPVPPSTADQTVSIVNQKLPGQARRGKESKYGNEMLYVEGKAGADGTIPLSVTYRVKRNEVVGESGTPPRGREEAEQFLQADTKVPVGGKSLMLLEGRKLPMDQLKAGKVLYDIVNAHMRYSKEGVGWGQGDSDWACDSKFGNCSDFHSMFISLARAQKIPAKFEMGFPVPEKRGEGEIGGYHCWAFFKPDGKGWVPVDISEANKFPKMREYYFGNLTEDRVTFTTGRDITLEPKQDGPPLNFLIYPYAEVNGKPVAADKIKRKFNYQDI